MFPVIYPRMAEFGSQQEYRWKKSLETTDFKSESPGPFEFRSGVQVWTLLEPVFIAFSIVRRIAGNAYFHDRPDIIVQWTPV